MPVNVIRLDATGRQVEEVGTVDYGALQRAVDDPGDYPQLSRIDVYGETEFDDAALEPIIEEWRRLDAETTNDRELASTTRGKRRPAASSLHGHVVDCRLRFCLACPPSCGERRRDRGRARTNGPKASNGQGKR